MKKNTHRRLAASASSRWMRCVGSIPYIEFLKKEKKIPDNTDNKWSILGTSVHSIIEYCIINNVHPEQLTPKTIKNITKSRISKDDMPRAISGAQTAYLYVENAKNDYDEIEAERKYDLSFVYDIDIGGTADISGFKQNKNLLIADYKNGKTIVDVEDNSQLKIYSLGAYYAENEWYNFRNVTTTIIQPNAPHSLGRIRSDSFTIDDLKLWEEKKLIPAIEAIRDESATLTPGVEQCTWCEAKHLCPANAKQSLQLAQIDFKNVASPKPELPAPSTLTDQQISFILDNKYRIEQFLNACEKHVYTSIEKGKIFKNYTLEDKYSNRIFKEDKVVKSQIRKNKLTIKECTITPDPKLMGITQLEQYLKSIKKWDKERIYRFMDSVTTKNITGKELVKTQITAEKDFSKLEKPKTSVKRRNSKTQTLGGQNGSIKTKKRIIRIKSKTRR